MFLFQHHCTDIASAFCYCHAKKLVSPNLGDKNFTGEGMAYKL